jgi:4-oxalocrotonate tautomerase
MPLIEVTLVDGRSPEQIRSMMRAVHQAAAGTLDIESEYINVIVRTVSEDHWSTGDLTVREMEASGRS